MLFKLRFYKDFENREICFNGLKPKIKLSKRQLLQGVEENNGMGTPNH